MKSEFRNFIKTPKSLYRLTPKALHIISLYNLIYIGVSIDINTLTVEEAYYLEYYGTRKKKNDEEIRFQTLFENLCKMFK